MAGGGERLPRSALNDAAEEELLARADDQQHSHDHHRDDRGILQRHLRSLVRGRLGHEAGHDGKGDEHSSDRHERPDDGNYGFQRAGPADTEVRDDVVGVEAPHHRRYARPRPTNATI